MRAHVTLMSVGVSILETVKPRGLELSIAPIPLPEKPEKGKRPKVREITINILKNGRPHTEQADVDEVVASITKLIARRHESERSELIQEGLVIRMKPEEVKEVKKYPTPAAPPPAKTSEEEEENNGGEGDQQA